DKLISERSDADARQLVVLGILLRQPSANRLHLRLRLLNAYAWSEKTDSPEVMGRPFLRRRLDYEVVVRHPDFAALGEVESSRHDADDGQLKLTRFDSFPDNVRIALEYATIEGIADHRHRAAAFFVIVVVQETKLGLHAKDVKEICVRDRAIDLRGDVVGKNAVRIRRVVRERLEAMALSSPIEKVGQGDLSDAAGARPERPDRNDALRILIRKRTQHYGIHNREDRRVGADAQSEDGNRN